ncbi:hypothetical protein HAX54_036133, partial [Datura stramonium]|nr:hypothetical protein [Datura stramonium]
SLKHDWWIRWCQVVPRLVRWSSEKCSKSFQPWMYRVVISSRIRELFMAGLVTTRLNTNRRKVTAIV